MTLHEAIIGVLFCAGIAMPTAELATEIKRLAPMLGVMGSRSKLPRSTGEGLGHRFVVDKRAIDPKSTALELKKGNRNIQVYVFKRHLS